MSELTIENLKDASGWYVSEDGCQHDAFGYYMNGVFDFCGCGMTEYAMQYIHDGMQLVDDLKQLVWENKQTYEDWREKVSKFFGTTGQEYFFYYVLDSKGLTEHGGSVPGWLTDKGINTLRDLKIITSNIDKYRD